MGVDHRRFEKGFFEVILFLTFVALCLTVTLAVELRLFLATLMLAVVSVGLIVVTVATINLLPIACECWRRPKSGDRVDLASRDHYPAHSRSALPYVDTVVATAETLIVDESESSIVFLGPNVDDSDIAKLRELRELRWLVLDYTDVTDAGLLSLSSLTKLRRVYVRNTRVTLAGISRLQDRLPSVEILH